MTFFFNGQARETPAVLSKVDDTAMFNQAAGVGNVLALVGKAESGKPGAILTFGSPDQARAALYKGELLDAVVRAFDPSAETGGPSAVVAVRVDPATQSSLALKDSLAAVVINLSSESYGLRENQIKVKVEAATGGRGLKLTTQRGNDFYTADNVFRNAFKIRYGGAQASGVMTVNTTQVVLQAPSGTTVATLDLNTFPTVQEVVDAINAVSGFTASVQDGNGSTPALNGLDVVTAQDVKTADYIARADLQAAVDWFNSSAEGFVTATRATEVGTLPAAIPFTYLAGGSNGSTTNTEWTNAFSALQTADVQWLVPVSSDPSIHAMADAHAAFMSSNGKERRVAVGSPLATSDASALTLAKAFNSDRTSLVHLGGYDYDENGALKLYAPYIVAAMFAAAFCGVNPGTPLTSKSLKLRGVERKLRNPTDTDALLKGGVVPIEDTPTGVRIVQSITTWLTNKNFNRREQSVGVAIDYAQRAWREALANLKGGKNTPQALGLAISQSETILSELAKPESAGGLGVLAGDADNPPFRNLRASLNGDRIEVTGQISPVVPTNYVAISIFAVPFSASASIA